MRLTIDSNDLLAWVQAVIDLANHVASNVHTTDLTCVLLHEDKANTLTTKRKSYQGQIDAKVLVPRRFKEFTLCSLPRLSGFAVSQSNS